MLKGIARAAVWIDQSKVKIREIDIPDIKDDCMLIKVNAAGICGTDGHVYPQKPPYPSILGHEVVGTIVEMGKKANESIKSFSGKLNVGDRIAIYPWITCGHCINCITYGTGACTVCEDSFVYGLPYEMTGLKGKPGHSSNINDYPFLVGGFAEYMYIFPGTFVWKLPDQMPDSVGSLLDPLAVAVRTVELGIRSPGVIEGALNTNSKVLVIGDGPIGALCALVARIMGVDKIIILGGRNIRLTIAKDLSQADCVINYHAHSLSESKQIVNDLTNGQGADIVFQCVGNGGAFRDGIELMKRVGTLVETGNLVRPGALTFDPAADLCAKHATYIGMSVNTPFAFNKAFNILTRYEKYDFEKIFTHKCRLETLDQTLKKITDQDYMKGLVVF